MARRPSLDRLNLVSLPELPAVGRRQTSWIELPEVVDSKLEVSVSINALERIILTNSLNIRVQFSTDGSTLNRPQYRWRWQGNTKTGRGDNGTTCRIDHLAGGEQWMNGLFVRVVLDAPLILTYSVSVDLM